MYVTQYSQDKTLTEDAGSDDVDDDDDLNNADMFVFFYVYS